MNINKENIIYSHEDMKLEYLNSEKGLMQLSFNPSKKYKRMVEPVPLPNFMLDLAHKPFNPHTGYTDTPLEMTMENVMCNKENIVFSYKHYTLGLKVIVDMKLIPGVNMIQQSTTIINESDEPKDITHLSSMFINGIATGGMKRWYDNDKIKLHYCRQTWSGEGQWRSSELDELGLYNTSEFPSCSRVQFSSRGTWSTGRYLPMAIIEDMETNHVWYFQIETSSDWNFEIGCQGTWDDLEKGALFIHADGANEKTSGWTKKLLPKESFTSVPVAFGCCEGNFVDAIKELTKYRRTTLKPKSIWNSCPVVYNDFNNTLFADPSKEKLLPLIDAASKAGAEYFCIDAGWFGDKSNPDWNKGLGDWMPSKDRFGDDGLQGIFDYIKSKGMIPGIWLEFEVCGEKSELGKKPDEWFLLRNGKRTGGGDRWLLNMTNPEVRSYLHGVIDRLVGMGVGFFKNDYNTNSIGNDSNISGNSPANELLSHIRALYKFIDEIREKHPTLFLENCGSGGMRADYGILSHFHIQSMTDQVDCYKNPSLIGGSLAGILPEQLGIWVFPYPLRFLDRQKPELLTSFEYQKSMADGEQTIFNMINGMCGGLYLSGYLNAANDLNMELVQEGVSLYKKEREYISNSYPILPIGFTKVNNMNSWAAVGLTNNENTRILLAVWRLESGEEFKELPLEKWAGKKAVVKQLYPIKDYAVNCNYNENKGILTVYLPKMCQARYFEIVSME